MTRLGMRRRAFLGRVLTVPAVLPLLGGLTALVGASEPEVQGMVAGLEADAPQAERVYDWWQVSMSDSQLSFHDIPAPPLTNTGALDWEVFGRMVGDGIPLAARNVLVLDRLGNLVRWGLDTGRAGWPVSL